MYEERVVKNASVIRRGVNGIGMLTKETFRYVFSSVFSELIRVIVNLDFEEKLLSEEECGATLAILKRLLTLMEVMVTITKKNDKQMILSCTIKHFGQFMSFFLDVCWKFLTKLLVRFASEVVFVVKIIQRCTRQIQSLCAHAKIVKDGSMLSYVPKIKKQLEQLIYVIKETLKKEGAEDAFWLGNLKNRYLNGKEVTEEGDRKLSERKRSVREATVEECKRVKEASEDTEETSEEE